MYYPPEFIHFAPGRIGGLSDWTFTKNRVGGGSTNLGEVRISGCTYYKHPDGRIRTPEVQSGTLADTSVFTPFGESATGIFFLMWSDENIVDRFTTFSGATLGVCLNIIPVQYVESTDAWRAVDNVAATETFTPLATDVLLARCSANDLTFGINTIESYVTPETVTNDDAETPPADNYLICQRSGIRVSTDEGLVKEWTGLHVRRKDMDRRHPQELIRARPEKPGPGSPSPEPEDRFIDETYPNGVTVNDLG